ELAWHPFVVRPSLLLIVDPAPWGRSSYGCVSTLASTNSNGILDRRDEDLAVTDSPGLRRRADRLDGFLDKIILDAELDLHLGKKIDDVLGAAIELGVPLLPAEAFGLDHRDAFQADLVERVLHLIQFEGLDDRFDLLHLLG